MGYPSIFSEARKSLLDRALRYFNTWDAKSRVLQ